MIVYLSVLFYIASKGSPLDPKRCRANVISVPNYPRLSSISVINVLTVISPLQKIVYPPLGKSQTRGCFEEQIFIRGIFTNFLDSKIENEKRYYRYFSITFSILSTSLIAKRMTGHTFIHDSRVMFS